MLKSESHGFTRDQERQNANMSFLVWHIDVVCQGLDNDRTRQKKHCICLSPMVEYLTVMRVFMHLTLRTWWV
jgi:hypothetical protein